jgi:hypothetical protein
MSRNFLMCMIDHLSVGFPAEPAGGRSAPP